MQILEASLLLLRECSERDNVSRQERLDRDALYEQIAQWKRHSFVNFAFTAEPPEQKPLMNYIFSSSGVIAPKSRAGSVLKATGCRRKRVIRQTTRRVKRGFIIPGCLYQHNRITNSRVTFSREVKYTVISDSETELAARREHFRQIQNARDTACQSVLDLQQQFGRDSAHWVNRVSP